MDGQAQTKKAKKLKKIGKVKKVKKCINKNEKKKYFEKIKIKKEFIFFQKKNKSNNNKGEKLIS